MDQIFCNRCGADLTGHDRRRKRVPCFACGSLTRRFDVTVHATLHGTLPAFRQNAVVRVGTVAAETEVLAPTIVVTRASRDAAVSEETEFLERIVHDPHFEHVLRCWCDGDSWIVNATSPNGMPFMATGDDVHEMLRAAAEAIGDEID